MKTCLPVLMLLTSTILVGCKPADPVDKTTTNESTASRSNAPDSMLGTPAKSSEASASELNGTAWRLIKISSMDDSVFQPEDNSNYTLSFNAEGQVAIQADCNRGAGGWTSESASQLGFSAIAATRAMCPPESLSDRYLSQFEWVRSYVLRDGHLFLATMADGAIIEFEPIE